MIRGEGTKGESHLDSEMICRSSTDLFVNTFEMCKYVEIGQCHLRDDDLTKYIKLLQCNK